MTANIDPETYNRLRDELVRLRAMPVPDAAAISHVMAQLDAEQLRLKAADGQPGNNPIRDRYD